MARGARTVREDNSRRGRGGEAPARPSVPLPAARRRGEAAAAAAIGAGRAGGRAGGRARSPPPSRKGRGGGGRPGCARAAEQARHAHTHARGGPRWFPLPFSPPAPSAGPRPLPRRGVGEGRPARCAQARRAMTSWRGEGAPRGGCQRPRRGGLSPAQVLGASRGSAGRCVGRGGKGGILLSRLRAPAWCLQPCLR